MGKRRMTPEQQSILKAICKEANRDGLYKTHWIKQLNVALSHPQKMVIVSNLSSYSFKAYARAMASNFVDGVPRHFEDKTTILNHLTDNLVRSFGLNPDEMKNVQYVDGEARGEWKDIGE